MFSLAASHTDISYDILPNEPPLQAGSNSVPKTHGVDRLHARFFSFMQYIYIFKVSKSIENLITLFLISQN